MKIEFTMLWDQLNIKYPQLETSLYGSHVVRGVKLLPKNSVPEADYLYLSEDEDGLILCCGGSSAVLDCELSFDILFNSLQDIFNSLRDWDMDAHVALIEGCTPQKLLDISHDVLGNPITLMDPSYKLLAISAHRDTPSGIFNQVKELGYLPAETVEFYRLHGYMDALSNAESDELVFRSDGSVITVIYPIRVNGIIAAFLTMPCTNRRYSQGLADCFRYLANGVMLCMEHQLHTSDIDRYMYEYLLIDILNSKLSGPHALDERLRYIDLPRTDTFTLLAVDGGKEYASVSSYLVRQIAECLPNDRVFFYQGQILVLLSAKRLAWALDTISPLLSSNKLSCGISRRFTDLINLKDAYDQASAALRLGSRRNSLRSLEKLGVSNISYEEGIYHYRHYAPYRMVEDAADKSILSPYIVRLVCADRDEGTDHLRVLHSYLSCERRPTQTAAALHMHRNNVIYRIDRIEQLLGISLDEAAVRSELLCSLLALELISSGSIQQNAQ